MRRSWLVLVALAATLAALVVVAAAGGTRGHGKHLFPASIALPNGFQPEGIDIRGLTSTSARFPQAPSTRLAADRAGDVLVPARRPRGDGTRGRPPWAAVRRGGRHGPRVRIRRPHRRGHRLVPAGERRPSFVNDVVVTRQAAWFTDSVQQGALQAAARAAWTAARDRRRRCRSPVTSSTRRAST